ncbi:TIGR03885 family FMN-dependent LLM class oxidoreductase [Lysobacter arvi]|uniref:TIGR03885 family FMN-dependent LLM class oxidoreductase n=1 Tax=Lysobacter arvi TaxID=3038776 RepID=A0ABU1CAL4_9GAMM|nr:TIGR03885 family FMN-dependent LLM class oxidoreductase [Lysobacter arvi]MDR0182160.1 TIGR03885 family FMN-dependent LLM class oxidoreductase [Lysobacter arvi]
MTTLGYHASHEQFPPGELLDLAAHARQAGFDAMMCSDHFHPWSRAQGQSGHAWSWLGAAMARVDTSFGVVNSPVGRYHPAVIAQAVATLASMFPERFWLAVGSGEAINETITGEEWPSKDARNRRLLEAVQVMRALWRGETVNHRGAFRVEHAQLFTRPESLPQVYVAALSPETAAWGAQWADGLITVSQPMEKLRPIVQAFRDNGGADKPLLLQVKLSYAQSDEDALRGAHEQWRTNVVEPALTEDVSTPQAYEALGERVTPEKVAGSVHVSADPSKHVAWLRAYVELGFHALYLHNVNRWQREFIDVFGREVLPALR